jgi:hypothetical protein
VRLLLLLLLLLPLGLCCYLRYLLSPASLVLLLFVLFLICLLQLLLPAVCQRQAWQRLLLLHLLLAAAGLTRPPRQQATPLQVPPAACWQSG